MPNIIQNFIADAKSVKSLFLSEWEKYFQSKSEFSNYEKLFLGVVVVQTIVILIISILNISTTTDIDEPKYGTLFVVTVFANAIFAFDGVFHQNIIILIAFLIFSVFLCLYSLLSLVVFSSSGLFISQLIICLIAFTSYLFFVYQLSVQFGWDTFTKLGANVDLRNLFQWFQVFIAAIKFDMAYSVLLTVMVGLFLLPPTDYELYVCIIVLLMEFYWAFYGYWFIKEENPRSFFTWLLFGCIQPLYALWKVNDFTWIRAAKYTSISSSIPMMSILGTVSIIVRIGVLFIATYLKRNFGRGLKAALSDDAAKGRERSSTFVE